MFCSAVALEELTYDWCMSVATLGDGPILCGTSGGGVYRRTPGQTNWVPHNDGFPPAAGRVLALSGGQLLFVGTPIGLFKSRDGGATWNFLAFAGEPVTAIALPATRGRHRAGGSDHSGLYVSYDEGESVQDRPTVGRTPLVVYVGTHRGDVYHSRDGGDTWQVTNNPKEDVITQVVEPLRSPGLAFAVTLSRAVYRSTDGGKGWELLRSGDKASCNDAKWATLAVSPNGAKLALGSSEGAYFSRNGGLGWEPMPGGALGMDYYVNQLLFADDDSDTLYSTMTRGIFKASLGLTSRTS